MQPNIFSIIGLIIVCLTIIIVVYIISNQDKPIRDIIGFANAPCSMIIPEENSYEYKTNTDNNTCSWRVEK